VHVREDRRNGAGLGEAFGFDPFDRLAKWLESQIA
jgi:hypothetical protein